MRLLNASACIWQPQADLSLRGCYQARTDPIGASRGEHQNQKTYGDQYETRFEHVLRTHAQDVTLQIIKAYDQAVKPRLKDYIPQRDELISAAVPELDGFVTAVLRATYLPSPRKNPCRRNASVIASGASAACHRRGCALGANGKRSGSVGV